MRRTSILVSLFGLLSIIGCGKTGAPGPTGVAGSPGPSGTPGTPGTPGTNSTPVTVIQLCTSCTPSYPSTFPEVALCLQGQLYGVYSANGGFLSLLTPGVYSSDGINCTCNLTIGGNCDVVEN